MFEKLFTPCFVCVMLLVIKQGGGFMSDALLLELFERVKRLEIQVAELQKQVASTEPPVVEPTKSKATVKLSAAKDTTQYLFNGQIYKKNRLVLAVVKSYVSQNPDITPAGLASVFEKRLQGSFGVVAELNEAKTKWPEYERRFFTKTEDRIKLQGGTCIVCSQWGGGAIANIDRFLEKARQLGFQITEVH